MVHHNGDGTFRSRHDKGRNAKCHHLTEQSKIRPHTGQPQANAGFPRAEELQDPGGTESLGKNRCHSGSGHTHMKNKDKKRIQCNVYNCTDQHGTHSCPGMSLTADKRVQAYRQLHKNRTQKINTDVGRGIADGIVTGSEKIQQRFLKDKEKQHQKR